MVYRGKTKQVDILETDGGGEDTQAPSKKIGKGGDPQGVSQGAGYFKCYFTTGYLAVTSIYNYKTEQITLFV